MNDSTHLDLTACRVCGEEKPSSGFYSDRSKRIGHGTECKLCVKDRTKARYAADREMWIRRSAENKLKDPERYRAYERAYAQRNRARTAAREAEYRKLNRERYSEHHRGWYARNLQTAREQGRLNAAARRARLRGNGVFAVNDRDLRRALARSRNSCTYCDESLVGVLHWDHVLPVVRGGAHSVGNLVPACQRCNRGKSRSTIMEWRLRR